jgi:hypothetical protein
MYASIFAIALPEGSEWFVAIFILAYLIFWIKTLFEIANAQFENSSTKIMLFLVVLLTGIIGILIYILFGKQRRLTGLKANNDYNIN